MPKGQDGIGWVIKGQDGMDIKTYERPVWSNILKVYRVAY